MSQEIIVTPKFELHEFVFLRYESKNHRHHPAYEPCQIEEIHAIIDGDRTRYRYWVKFVDGFDTVDQDKLLSLEEMVERISAFQTQYEADKYRNSVVTPGGPGVPDADRVKTRYTSIREWASHSNNPQLEGYPL